MPVGFILVGVLFIYIIFFKFEKNNVARIFFCLCLMTSFFVAEIYLGKIYFNWLLLLCVAIIYITSIYILPIKKSVNVIAMSLLQSSVYVILVRITIDFISEINIFPALISILVFGVIFIFDSRAFIFYVTNCYLQIGIINLIINQEFLSVGITNMEMYNYLLIICCGGLIINFVKDNYLQKRRSYEKKIV